MACSAMVPKIDQEICTSSPSRLWLKQTPNAGKGDISKLNFVCYVKGNEKWVQGKRCGSGSRKRDVKHESSIAGSGENAIGYLSANGLEKEATNSHQKQGVCKVEAYIAQIPGQCRAREGRLPLPPMTHIYSRHLMSNRASGLLRLERRSSQTTFVGNLWCRD